MPASCVAGSSTIWTPVSLASKMMPINRLTAIVPSSSSVVAALRDLGFRNAGTPLLIASTPVSAAQPDENDRSTRNENPNPTRLLLDATRWKCELSAWMLPPAAERIRPQTTMPNTPTMKPYVGIANAAPDSLMPRRLATVSSAITARQNSGVWAPMNGIAEPMLAMPEDVDTAT